MRTTLQAVSERQFDRVVETSTAPVLVEFWKSGCNHFHALTGELEHVQEDVVSSLLILTMNVEKKHQTPAELEITSPPVLAFYRNGEFRRFIGGLGKRDEIVKQIGLESRR